jgi:hypothetical protein
MIKPKKKKTVTEAAAVLDEVCQNWNGKGSVYALTVRTARRQFKGPIFNIAAWLKFNYGPLYSGETEADWIRSAKDVLRIAQIR